MDPHLRRTMFRYYDERASEYEEAYLLGTGTASIADPTVFQTDAKKLAEVVGRYVSGRVIDIAAGTAFWLPHYAAHARTITLIDQSRSMLDECRKKVTGFGLETTCIRAASRPCVPGSLGCRAQR